MKKIAVFILLVTLTSCSTLGIRRGVDQKDRASVKNIGVISLLGNKFNNIFVGTTAFTNEESFAQVNWGIDEFASNYAYQELYKKGKYNISILQPSQSLISQIDKDNEHMPSIIDMFTDHADTSSIFDTAAANGIDTLYVISPTYYDNAPLFKPSYGFFEKDLLGMSNSCPYALFVVGIYDVKTKSELGWQWGFDSWTEGPCYGSMNDKIPYKPQANQYSQAEMEYINSAIKAKISDGIVKATAGLGL